MHSSRMRTAHLHIVRGGGGGVVTWSRGGRWLTIGVGHIPPGLEVTHACEIITLDGFATRAVEI